MLKGDTLNYIAVRLIYLCPIDPKQTLAVSWGSVLQAALLEIPAEQQNLGSSFPTPHPADFY